MCQPFRRPARAGYYRALVLKNKVTSLPLRLPTLYTPRIDDKGSNALHYADGTGLETPEPTCAERAPERERMDQPQPPADFEITEVIRTEMNLRMRQLSPQHGTWQLSMIFCVRTPFCPGLYLPATILAGILRIVPCPATLNAPLTAM